MTPMSLFWPKVAATGSVCECWLWTGAIGTGGYGAFGRPTSYAHRLAYSSVFGEIPDGAVIDHLCRERSCVNPWHLEAVTQKENVRRGLGCKRTHCKNGHEFDEENTYLRRKESGRYTQQCKACGLERQRRAR